MRRILDPASAEARALEAKRPDLLRVVSGLRTTDRQRQAIESWDRHAEIDNVRERSKRVAADLDISVNAAQQLLGRVGLIQTKPGADRRTAVQMFKEGASVDDVRAELQKMHDLTLYMAIGDLANDLAAAQKG